jgi:RNA polymerase sigma-70 factor (ECF subfamily)
MSAEIAHHSAMAILRPRFFGKPGRSARVVSATDDGVRQVAEVAESEMLLLQRLRQGERAAFDELARVHGPRLVRLAQRLLGYGRHDDATDAVQEVFARLLAHPRRIAGRGELGPWLTTVVANQCRTQQRRFLSRLKLVKGWTVQQTAVENTADDVETDERVRRAVGRLRPGDREVIVLHHLEELSIDRIASMLNASRNAVEVRLHRARKRLKEILEEA